MVLLAIMLHLFILAWSEGRERTAGSHYHFALGQE